MVSCIVKAQHFPAQMACGIGLARVTAHRLSPVQRSILSKRNQYFIAWLFIRAVSDDGFMGEVGNNEQISMQAIDAWWLSGKT